jgi:two-component system, OmpR family, response regulator MtrA
LVVVRSRILLVEDDRSVREAATLVLERAGFAVDAVDDGHSGIENARQHPYDAVVLDLMLPEVDGFDVCRDIRRSSNVPIVMLTARADLADLVTGLELGADDYITKPFRPAELVARVRAAVRRSTADPSSTASRIAVRDLIVDEDAFRAFQAEEELSLTTTEFRLLATLMRNAGSVLTREVLLERVWGYDYLGDSRLVDMAVKRLRDKLAATGDQTTYVATVRGVGYRFETG